MYSANHRVTCISFINYNQPKTRSETLNLYSRVKGLNVNPTLVRMVEKETARRWWLTSNISNLQPYITLSTLYNTVTYTHSHLVQVVFDQPYLHGFTFKNYSCLWIFLYIIWLHVAIKKSFLCAQARIDHDSCEWMKINLPKLWKEIPVVRNKECPN